MRIEPTVGRVVWFYPATNCAEAGFCPPSPGEPLAAIIAKVWSSDMVNLTVFDANGVAHSRTSVPLNQDGHDLYGGYYCTWMPYQRGQAAKTEQLEAEFRRQASAGLQKVAAAHDGSNPTFDDLIDGASKAYDEAPVTGDAAFKGWPELSHSDGKSVNQYRSDLPPNAGWTRDTRGDRPGDQFDERGVPIAGIPGQLVPDKETRFQSEIVLEASNSQAVAIPDKPAVG